jgi:peptidoglycan/LPS O-acetylase OafA/YrhL
MTPLRLLLLGAIAMASFTIALIFLRFWATTRDRFFGFFAAAFAIAGGGRVIQALVPQSNEQAPLIYLTQLAAFLVIIYAIIDKNRAMKRNNGRT